MRRAVILPLLAGCLIQPAVVASPRTPAKPAQIDKLVQDLGAPDFETRETAFEALLSILSGGADGAEDADLLLAALQAEYSDAEVQERVARLKRMLPTEPLVRKFRAAGKDYPDLRDSADGVIRAIAEIPLENSQVPFPHRSLDIPLAQFIAAAGKDPQRPLKIFLPFLHHRQPTLRAVGLYSLWSWIHARQDKNPSELAGVQGLAELLPIARRLLQDASPAVRTNAIRVVARLGDPAETLAVLREVFAADPDPRVRLFAAATLGHRKDRASREAIETWLESGDLDSSGRLQILQALTRLGDPASLPAIERFLESKGLKESMRQDAAGCIVSLSLESAETRFKPIQHASPLVRKTAIERFANLRDVSAAPEIAKALRDPDPEVRCFALRAFARFNDLAYTQEITNVLGDPDPMTRYAALETLKTLKDPASAGAVAKLLSDSYSGNRREALIILEEIRDPAHAEAIRECLADQEPHVWHQALAALRALGYPVTRDEIDKALKGPDPEAKRKAQWVLDGLRDPSQLEKFETGDLPNPGGFRLSSDGR